MDKNSHMGSMIGKLTSCVTGKESDVTVFFDVKYRESGKVFQLYGGPTSFESFYITEKSIEALSQGWVACIGTSMRWDRLFIPREEMVKAFNIIKSKEK